MPDEISLEPLPFDEAIAYFRALLPLTDEEFFALAAAAQSRAFTISGVAAMDVIMDCYNAVEKAIAAGETLADFKGRIADIMEARGWEGLTPWHAETMFRTNVQSAYMGGRYKQMVEGGDAFPFWEYDAVNDSHTRPTHAAHDGKVYPADHPFWDTWYPPNGYNCRCSVNPVHRLAAEAEGLRIETDDPTNTLVEPVDPVTGKKLPARPLVPDPGFDTNAAKAAWEPDLTKYPDDLKEQFENEQL